MEVGGFYIVLDLAPLVLATCAALDAKVRGPR